MGRSRVAYHQFLIWRGVALGQTPRTTQRLNVLCNAASTLLRLHGHVTVVAVQVNMSIPL